MKKEWDHKDEWRKRRVNFLVEISRHEVPIYEDDVYEEAKGPVRWAVYAYIYPKHPAFTQCKKVEGHIYCPLAFDLPLHRGPSFCQIHERGGVVTSYQIGADYDHEEDYRFTFMATPEEAAEVFQDAERLVEWLENYKGETNEKATY